MSKFWDEKFKQDDFLFGTQPNGFLVEQAGLLAPGQTVLVPGDGEGRNGIWLAQQGLAVTAVDSSAVGQGKAKHLAAQRGVQLDFRLADLLAWDWPQGQYDHVVSIFFHLHSSDRPAVHRAMLQALKPGGLLMLEAFRPQQLGLGSGGPSDADLLYDQAMLRGDFDGAEIVLLTDADPVLDEGPVLCGSARTVRLIVRRPA